MTLYCKDPQAIGDHGVDWSDYLVGEQAIAASAWSVSPEEDGGLTIAAEALDGARTSARIGGGVAGHVYRLTNRVTLDDGQVDDRSLTIRVEER